MFTPASVKREVTLCSVFDEALDLPVVPDVDESTLTEEQLGAHKKLVERYEAAVRTARETQNWPVKDGEKPTYFKFREIQGPTLTWWQGECERRQFKQQESFELMFRLALTGLKNCPGVDLKFEKREGEQLVRRDALEPIYNIGRDVGRPALGRMIILELGGLVAARAVSGVPPL
jgi:hypothetical protein